MAHLRRVTYANPAPKRAKKRHKKAKESPPMARKRRKKRTARKRSSPKRKAFRRRKRRHAVASPVRRKRRRVRRAHVARRKRRHRRGYGGGYASPNDRGGRAPRRVRRKRRHRRNPNLPMWAMAGLAMLGAGASYALVSAGSFAVTQHTDPTLQTLERNRHIAAGLAALGGVALALKGHPLAGVAVGAGGVVASIGVPLTLQVSKLVEKKPAAPPPAQVPVAAIYGQDLQGYAQLAGYLPAMGAAYGQDMRGIQDSYTPAPPWAGGGPF